MSIEEKAKTYDEALEITRKLHEEADEPLQKIYEGIFPQLKKSEDEKIREALISVLKSDFEKETTIHGITVETIITWLEKENNLMKALQISNARIGELVEENYYLKENSEWNEEDEMIYQHCLTILHDYGYDNWFKLLRAQKQFSYNPYKEVVESIAEMCKHYNKASHSGLQDFYDNVKCKDAKEYDSLFPQKQCIIDGAEMQKSLDVIFKAIDKAKEELRKGNNGSALEALCIQYPVISIVEQWKPTKEQLKGLKSLYHSFGSPKIDKEVEELIIQLEALQ